MIFFILQDGILYKMTEMKSCKTMKYSNMTKKP